MLDALVLQLQGLLHLASLQAQWLRYFIWSNSGMLRYPLDAASSLATVGRATTCCAASASLHFRHYFEEIDLFTFNAVIGTLGNNHFNVNYTRFFIQILDWQRSEYFQGVKDIHSLPIVTGMSWTDDFAYAI